MPQSQCSPGAVASVSPVGNTTARVDGSAVEPHRAQPTSPARSSARSGVRQLHRCSTCASHGHNARTCGRERVAQPEQPDLCECGCGSVGVERVGARMYCAARAEFLRAVVP